MQSMRSLLRSRYGIDNSQNGNNMNYMSQLPDAILQHILFFLPTQDAARASILSKTWLRVWKSLPLFKFSFYQHQLGLAIPEFVTRVNQSLSPLQHHKAVIQSFILVMSLSQQEQKDFVSDIDNWICLLMRNCVRELAISISSPIPNYILPEAIFTSKSLVVLKLHGCKFPSTLFADAQYFRCLKDLYLLGVVANEDQIQNLINSCCPSLEQLTLKLHDIVNCLVLYNFMMLHYVFAKVKILMLDAVNLHTLKFSGLRELYLSDSTVNIKHMYCSFSTQISNPINLFEGVLSGFSLLEDLHLNLGNNVRRYQIQHCHLKTLHLYGSTPQNPFKVEIDTPYLCQLYCYGDVFPSLSVTSPSIKECETLQLYIHNLHSGIRDGSHIHHLGIFLQNFHQNIEVNLDDICTKNSLTLEQLQGENVISRPSKVRKLILNSVSSSSDYTSFLDRLLLTCHPSSLLIEKCLVNSDNFIKFLCSELMGRQRNPTCCRDNLLPKCWRHFLKGVEVQCHKRLCEPEELLCLVSSNLSNTFSMCDTGKRVEFRFEWLEDPVCSSFQDL